MATPVPKPSLHDSIQCFALPYGGFGFLFHGLTFWTILCLMSNKSPMHLRDLTNDRFTFILTQIGMFAGLGLALSNTFTCEMDWGLMLISIWKASLTIVIALVGSIASYEINHTSPGKLAQMPFRLYPFGFLSGLAGMTVIVKDVWGDHRIKMACLAGLGLYTVLIMSLYYMVEKGLHVKRWEDWGERTLVILVLPLMIVSGPLCDWILAIVAENMSGIPKVDESVDILPWAYYMVATLAPVWAQ